MLELEEARNRILSFVPAAGHERVALDEAHRRVLVEDLTASVNLPLFDNSAMDGYAVRAEDVRTASPETPVRLHQAGRIAAGEVFAGELSSGNCARLFTGSMLPRGADCVVMQEDTRTDAHTPSQVVILEAARPWENVRFKGEDLRAGAALAAAGQVISAGHLSLLAACGIAHVKAGRRPTVGVVATGSELREPGTLLLPGQIYESNRVGLAALIRQAGAKPVIFPIAPDTLEDTKRVLGEAFSQCDLVISAGGASVGDLDLVKPALAEIGGALEFWKIAIKPGRPFIFGRMGEKLLFGLPGNPVSAMVTFLLLVRPVLMRWQGATEVELPQFSGVLTEPLANPGPRRHFMRVRLDVNGQVSLAGAQASHVLRSFAEAQGLVDVPPHSTLATGTSVRVRVWGL